jgi:hypothetical protein
MTADTNARVILAVAAQVDDDFIWDRLDEMQTQMFAAGPVAIKLAYFGREVVPPNRPFVATRWATDSDDLADLLDKARAHCACGCYVQIGDLFAAALEETRQAPVQAVIVIGDVFHGDPDATLARARELHASGMRLFLFQQDSSSHSTRSEEVFRTLAEQTGGAYFKFNPAVERVAQRLPSLLEAISHFAIGGSPALAALSSAAAESLLDQIDTPLLKDRE